MGDQTHREPEDLARKRREYVRKRWLLFFQTAFSVVLVLLSGTLMLLATYGLWFSGKQAIYWLRFAKVDFVFLICAAALSLVGVLAWRGSNKETASLPYVPPLSEELAALPADEILLRGSDEPAATPGELLRAAQAGAADSAEELLRAEAGKLI